MPSIHSLQPPEPTAEERRVLIDVLLALRKTHIQSFLRRVDVPGSGTKADLREAIQSAVDDGRITYEEIVEFLDSLAPYAYTPQDGARPPGMVPAQPSRRDLPREPGCAASALEPLSRAHRCRLEGERGPPAA